MTFRKVVVMNVLAINTSPDGKTGNASLLLEPFIEGMRDSGACVEVCNTDSLFIFPCCGNIKCTLRTPGKCMQYDDMKWLRPKISDADVVVLASPQYCEGKLGPDGATDHLRSLLGRLNPGAEVSTDDISGPVIRPPVVDVRLRKIVMVSNCGFWEINDFYPVLTHVKAFCKNAYPSLAGAVFEPHDVLLRGVLTGDMSNIEVIETAKAAGRRLVRDMTSPTRFMDDKSREHLAREVYLRIMDYEIKE